MKKKIAGYVSEHEHGLVHLTFLRDAIARILYKGKNADDLQIVDDSYCFLTKDLMVHCAKEETDLFPLLQDVVAQSIIRKLVDEHILINIKLVEFRNVLSLLKSNTGDFKQIIKVKQESELFFDLLYTHIKEENNLLQSVIRNFKTERKHNESKRVSI